MEIRHAHATGKARDFGPVPRDREEYRRVAEYAEIVGIVSVFPDVLAGKHQIPANCLLQANVKLISPSRGERRRVCRRATQQRFQNRAAAANTRDDQILVEGRLQYARVRDTKYGVARLDVVCNTEPRLRLLVSNQAVVEISSHANVE